MAEMKREKECEIRPDPAFSSSEEVYWNGLVKKVEGVLDHGPGIDSPGRCVYNGQGDIGLLYPVERYILLMGLMEGVVKHRGNPFDSYLLGRSQMEIARFGGEASRELLLDGVLNLECAVDCEKRNIRPRGWESRRPLAKYLAHLGRARILFSVTSTEESAYSPDIEGYEDAEEVLLESIELDDRSEFVHRWLGISQIYLGEAKMDQEYLVDAVRSLEKAVGIRQNSDNLLHLGEAQFSLAEILGGYGARLVFEEARKNFEHSFVLENSPYIYERLMRAKGAIQELD